MKSTFFKFIILSTSLIVLTQITNSILNFNDLLYNSLSEQLTQKQIQHFLELKDKWLWLGYAFVPIILLLKISIITAILHISLFLSNRDIKFKEIWNIVLNAEFIFLLVPVFKTFWFLFFEPNYALLDVQNFYPLSALNIIGYKALETWFIYPFQVLNLFELFYIIYLAFQIGKLTSTNADYGLKIISLSYVPGLLLWVATVMFFTLNLS